MVGLIALKAACLQLLLLHAFASDTLASSKKTPEYRKLPSLRDQAVIQDAWTKDRVSAIPRLLQKYGVDAWLVGHLTKFFYTHLPESR
jgi:hypothetical protein